ncbi:MAG: hypothetical protein GWN87_01660 [Desulfuromonadales bacterium]|nr:hypothetical protein [Desulfuromonadales bacterium]NIS39411.1 hypothetical protein [Desulfuromonadales bacterium]
MKSVALLIVLVLGAAATGSAADPYDPKQYDEIIEKRCTICHTRERIETAIEEGRDMNEILGKMMKMGATLTDREQEVLGTFWGSPTKK